MNHPTLSVLTSDEFLVRLGTTSNARAVHRALQRSGEVEAVRLALRQGQLDDEDLRDFVAGLLQQFQPGDLFPYDVTLAAVAVAVELRPTPFADELLSQLARLKRHEFPLAIGVARECDNVHSRLAGNASRSFAMAPPREMCCRWEPAPTFVKSDCQEDVHAFAYKA